MNSYLSKDHTYNSKGDFLEVNKKKKKIQRKTALGVYPFHLGKQKENEDKLYQVQTLHIDYCNCSE